MQFTIKKFVPYIVLAALLGVFFYAGFVVGQNQVVCKVCKPETVDFSLFWDAYGKLGDRFIEPEKITDKTILYGAIAGMTESLGDPYTTFFDPKQAASFKQDLRGSFDGIGVEVGIKKDQLTVIAPLKGTPGERAGLKAGDQIIQIDGKSTAGMAIDQAVGLIRGKRGTQVVLTIFRDGWNDTKEITITRDTIKVATIDWELKNGDVAYIRIHQFGDSLPQDFRKVALEILSGPAKKIVLDVRDNPGGYLQVCQDIAGWFLKSGQVVTLENFGGNREQQVYKAEGNGAFANYPTVVLINKGSASAAEILAGALRDNRGIKLVGEKSFGKGSVQEVVDLVDNASFLKITVAKWLTPKGSSIAEVGLTPDVPVAAAQEEEETDLQLQKALELISGMK